MPSEQGPDWPQQRHQGNERKDRGRPPARGGRGVAVQLTGSGFRRRRGGGSERGRAALRGFSTSWDPAPPPCARGRRRPPDVLFARLFRASSASSGKTSLLPFSERNFGAAPPGRTAPRVGEFLRCRLATPRCPGLRSHARPGLCVLRRALWSASTEPRSPASTLGAAVGTPAARPAGRPPQPACPSPPAPAPSRFSRLHSLTPGPTSPPPLVPSGRRFPGSSIGQPAPSSCPRAGLTLGVALGGRPDPSCPAGPSWWRLEGSRHDHAIVPGPPAPALREPRSHPGGP